MSETIDLLRRFQAWYDDALPELQAEGYVAKFSESVPKRPKPAAWVTLSSSSRMGRLTLWVTGEAQLGLGDAESGEFIEEHLEISGDLELADATRTLVAWVRGA